MVWVRPGKLPAKVIVAPNSPSARAQARTAPAAIPGATIGRVTRRNAVRREAPRVAAASSYRGSAARSAPSTLITRKGIATKVSAITTPVVVKGRVMPKAESSQEPTIPRRPSTSSSATPPTTGGSTSGRVTSARISRRPGSSVRASSQASGTPRTRETAVAAVAQISDSRRASQTALLVSCSDSPLHGARTRSPISGRTRNARPSSAGSNSVTGTRCEPGLRRAPRRRVPLRRGGAVAGSADASLAPPGPAPASPSRPGPVVRLRPGSSSRARPRAVVRSFTAPGSPPRSAPAWPRATGCRRRRRRRRPCSAPWRGRRSGSR